MRCRVVWLDIESGWVLSCRVGFGVVVPLHAQKMEPSEVEGRGGEQDEVELRIRTSSGLYWGVSRPGGVRVGFAIFLQYFLGP